MSSGQHVNENLVHAIISYGDRYRQELLFDRYNADLLRSDWWQALKFFFGRAFYQGRLDKVSARVESAALKVLEPAISHSNGHVDDDTVDELELSLQAVIGEGHVGKARDVEMIRSTLHYIDRLADANVVADSVARIKAGNIGQHYADLQISRNPSSGIRQVGPKIAAFYLRDLVTLFGLEQYVPSDFQFCLQPIDVWVRRLAVSTGIVGESASDQTIGQAIVMLCAKHGCSPLKFNQGAWYAGYNAFSLLLEALSKQLV